MNSPRHRTHRWLLAICLFAFALRLGLVLHAGERMLVDDETGYDNIALHVANGDGYQVGVTQGREHPTAARGPTYVFYIAGFYKIFGHRVVPPLVGQCVLDALCCLLVFFVAQRLFRSPRGALMAAALYALYPPFVLNAAQMITETLTNVVFLGGVAAFVHYMTTRRVRDLVIAGVAVGLGALIKPPMAPLGAVLALAAVRTLGWGPAVRAAVITSVVTGIVMSPWIIRNFIVFDKFVPGVTLVGYTFWGGTAPGGGIRTIGSVSDPAVPDSVRAALARVDGEVEQSEWFMQEGMRVIKQDPWRYAGLSFLKIPQLWLNVGFDEAPSMKSWVLAIFGIGAFALAACALRAGNHMAIAAPLIVWILVFWTLANLPAPVLIRYALPVYAVLFCYTGPGLSQLLTRLGWREPAEADRGVA